MKQSTLELNPVTSKLFAFKQQKNSTVTKNFAKFCPREDLTENFD